ncbi:MAG: HNH endonuclease [Planctomycetes bacterium]|nr:HNH endonuclease [Planctomycetota bacterium]
MDNPTPLDSSVLVLNRFYSVVHVISARRAFVLLFKQCAEVVSYENDVLANYDIQSWVELSKLKSQFRDSEDDWVKTPSVEIRVPRIIRLLVYDKLPERAVKFNRRNIYARDEGHCQYCGKKFPTSELTLDHVVPRSLGGATTWENIVCACVRCNVKKGGRRPEQAGMRLVRMPRKPRRSPVLKIKIRSEKYRSWRHFVDEAYWDVALK